MTSIDELHVQIPVFQSITKSSILIHSFSQSIVITTLLLENQKRHTACKSCSFHIQKGLHSNKVNHSSPLQCDCNAVTERQEGRLF